MTDKQQQLKLEVEILTFLNARFDAAGDGDGYDTLVLLPALIGVTNRIIRESLKAADRLKQQTAPDNRSWLGRLLGKIEKHTASSVIKALKQKRVSIELSK